MGWLSGWNNRITLTIDKDVVDTAAQTNFPLMVYLSAASGIGDVDVSVIFDELTSDANRKKIAITSSDGTTELYVEIERWDDVNEKAWLHVKVPTVAYDADTILYLYFDVDHADNTTYIGDSTDAVAHSVWNSDFKAVWHMAQDPNGDVADAIKESTSSAYDLTPNGTMLTADLVDGKVGKAIDLDGTDDYLDTDGNPANLNLSNSDFLIEWTMALGANPTDFGDPFFIFGLADASNERRSYWIDVTRQTFNYLRFQTFTDGTVGTTLVLQKTPTLVVDTIYHFAIQRDGSDLYFYLDGAVIGSAETIGTITLYNNTVDPFRIGLYQGLWWPSEILIDEFRITVGDKRSAAWIKATYNSLWDSMITFDTVTEVFATTATLALTTYSALLGTFVNANTASLIITTYPAGTPVIVICTTVALTLTPNVATVNWALDVTATTATLTITPNIATIWDGATWTAWVAANQGKITRLYYFVLTGAADGTTDATIPISSWQARRKSGEPTYLSVVIPWTEARQIQVEDRPNGTMKVNMAYVVDGVEQYRETICEADYESLRIDKGGRSKSMTLTGHKTETFTQKTIALQDVIYVSNDDGDYRYRCASCDLFLNPGDIATYDSNSITVNQIVYIVSANQNGDVIQTMDVNEATT